MFRTPTDRSDPANKRRCLSRDLKTIASFIQIYCDGHHRSDKRTAPTLETHDASAIASQPLTLCRNCRMLLAHAFVKRSCCPLHPKPACKKCPQHCYAPKYRDQIRLVMRYSGKRLVLQGRLTYAWHLLL